MIGILIVTHGKMAEGMKGGMELICGKQEKVETEGLYLDNDVEVFAEVVYQKAKALDDGDGVLIFTDFLSGSPSNVVSRFILREKKMTALAGVNFSMLLEAVNSRDLMSLQTLAETCLSMGKSSVLDLGRRLKETMQEEA